MEVEKNIRFGKNIILKNLNEIGTYIIITIKENFNEIKQKIKNSPVEIILNNNMELKNLEEIEKSKKPDKKINYIVGFGGGLTCDTAKYLAWKWKIPLILIPSIISTDAWLCTSIAIREDYKIKYVGDILPELILIDFAMIRRAPKHLNLAGAADVISITSALGDWKLAHQIHNEKFDSQIYNRAFLITYDLFSQAKRIFYMSINGIKAIVAGQINEVKLCYEWGNARPEEGSEHFLAYCLETLTKQKYIHGNLVALNTLVCLKLQRKNAVYNYKIVKKFFDNIGLLYSPLEQKIQKSDYRRALETISEYVKKENLPFTLWNLRSIFDKKGEYSIEGILDWIYSFQTNHSPKEDGSSS